MTSGGSAGGGSSGGRRARGWCSSSGRRPRRRRRSRTARTAQLAARPDANGMLAARRVHARGSSPGRGSASRAPSTSGPGFPDGAATFADRRRRLVPRRQQRDPLAGPGRGQRHPVRRRRQHRRRVPGARGHVAELRRRPDAVGHLAVVRGVRRRPGLGVRPGHAEQRRRPARPWGRSTTRPRPSTPTTRSSTSPRTSPTAPSTGSRPTAYPDLSAGLLEVASVDPDGAVTWYEVPDPSGAARARPGPRSPRSPRSTAARAAWFADGHRLLHDEGRQPRPLRSTRPPTP